MNKADKLNLTEDFMAVLNIVQLSNALPERWDVCFLKTLLPYLRDQMHQKIA